MQGFGAKVDARLKALERRIQDLETFSKALIMEEGIDWKAVVARIEALEAKRGPGRPPKAKNGD